MKKYLHYAWVICFGCAFICALTSPIINATATQYLISVTEEFGVSRSAFTLSSTIVALVGMVISPLWGKIYSDRKRMRGVLTITTLGFGLAYMSYSLAQNIGQFYISAVILGFFWAGACFMPVSGLLLKKWVRSLSERIGKKKRKIRKKLSSPMREMLKYLLTMSKTRLSSGYS